MSKTYRPDLNRWQLADEIAPLGGPVPYHVARAIQRAVEAAKAEGASLTERRMLAHSILVEDRRVTA